MGHIEGCHCDAYAVRTSTQNHDTFYKDIRTFKFSQLVDPQRPQVLSSVAGLHHVAQSHVFTHANFGVGSSRLDFQN